MFDWDKIVIEVDNNIVDLTAGEVALLIAADADTVTWGNITGDLAQQADLMLQLDNKIDVDSPEFTGTPRTPTPPAGNNSTRIANTEFVQNAVNGGINAIYPINYDTQLSNKPNFGTLAFKNSVNYQSEVTNKPTLGSLASKDKVNYTADIEGKPRLGSLASKNQVNYYDDIVDRPTLGTIASKNSVDYNTEVYNKPTIPVFPANTPNSFGSLASKNSVNYETEVYNKPTSPQTASCYVDSVNGSDGNTGTYESPFKTLQKAISFASLYGHTTITVRGGGRFAGPIKLNHQSVTILAADHATVSIYGQSTGDRDVLNIDNNSCLNLEGSFTFEGYEWAPVRVQHASTLVHNQIYSDDTLTSKMSVSNAALSLSLISLHEFSRFFTNSLTGNYTGVQGDWLDCVNAIEGSTAIVTNVKSTGNRLKRVFYSTWGFIYYGSIDPSTVYERLSYGEHYKIEQL